MGGQEEVKAQLEGRMSKCDPSRNEESSKAYGYS